MFWGRHGRRAAVGLRGPVVIRSNRRAMLEATLMRGEHHGPKDDAFGGHCGCSKERPRQFESEQKLFRFERALFNEQIAHVLWPRHPLK